MTLILARLDLSDPHNAHECAEEFRRARDFGGPTELLIWAQNWGNALVENLRNPVVDTDDLEKANEEATKFEDELGTLESAVEEAISDMDAASELPSEPRAAEYERIAEALEKALTK
jgi:hypothetical protein